MKILLQFIKLLLGKAEAKVEPIFIDFKTERCRREFKDLEKNNKNLFDLITDLSFFTKKLFNKPIVITMIGRTQAEQDDIYKNDSKYKQKKFKSPHQFEHAVDIRSRSFDKLEISKIEDYLNDKYNSSNYYKWTARNHNVGLGDHFHIQFSSKS